MSLKRFLKTKTPGVRLRAALKVVREFKACESDREWLISSFESWYMLERLESYLANLVEGKEIPEQHAH